MKKLYLVLVGFGLFIVSMHAKSVKTVQSVEIGQEKMPGAQKSGLFESPKKAANKKSSNKKHHKETKASVEPVYTSKGYHNYIESVGSGFKGSTFKMNIHFTKDPVFVFDPSANHDTMDVRKTLHFMMPYTGINLALKEKMLATKFGNNDFSITFVDEKPAKRDKTASLHAVVSYDSSLYGFVKTIGKKDVVCQFVPLQKN